jgi:hypothetical protein
VVKYLVEEQETHLLSYIILNWNKTNNAKLENVFGRNCIRVIPLVFLIKKIKYVTEEQESNRNKMKELVAIREENEFSDDEENQNNTMNPKMEYDSLASTFNLNGQFDSMMSSFGSQ